MIVHVMVARIECDHATPSTDTKPAESCPSRLDLTLDDDAVVYAAAQDRAWLIERDEDGAVVRVLCPRHRSGS